VVEIRLAEDIEALFFGIWDIVGDVRDAVLCYGALLAVSSSIILIGKYILIGRQSVAKTRRRKRLDFMLSCVTRAERQAAKISGARLVIK
jgi:hypothetical protein